MRLVSLSGALSLALALYVGNTLWSLREMFAAPGCARGERCLRSQLAASPRPRRHLALFASARVRPPPGRAARLHAERDFDYTRPQAFDIELEIPPATRNNGTLFMHITLVGEDKLHKSFEELQQSEPMETIPLITFTEPRAATFNLLNSKDESEAKKDKVRPVAHINPQIEFSIFTDDIKLPANRIPEELYPYLRVSGGKFLPIIQHNILKTRLKNLQQIDEHSRSVNVTVSYAPISFGLMRLNLHMHHTITHLKAMGFGEKDIDDVKGIFADTNLYLLSATVVIASCHLLFDFLAFKNDVSFWRSKKSMAGLSTRTVLWRAFSQCVILLYLFDENTSMIVLGPASVSAIIELWKAKKVLRISVEWRGWSRLPRVGFTEEQNSAEQRTRAVDAEAMRYLSYLLYPLCFAGAVYSLLYEPHKSWYSWCLNSTVNGVYAFGFLFMLPQLFVNYRLRSVAALPWRAFMYKAFNTFIDDIFAFVITMPTAHRVACFRDDIVFLIYLYQRWLYPVDKTRTDDSVSMDEPSEEPAEEPVKLKED